MPHRSRSLLVLALCPVLAGCPQDLSVELVPGSTVEDLRFRLSNRAGTAETGELFRFGVVEFGGIHGPGEETILWEISREGRDAGRVGELRYGSPPSGFRTVTPPAPLVPGGRYYATGGSAGVEFRVASDGSIRLFDPAVEADAFQAAGLREDEVRQLWEELRSALEAPDPDRVADLAYFPLRVTTPDSSWAVDDRGELVGAFDSVFPPELRARLALLGPEDLFSTSRGVAAAAGVVWIGEACVSERSGPCPPAVFEVNHREGWEG